MEIEDFQHLRQLEETFWWFVGMREIQQSLLDPALRDVTVRDAVDVGCGTGGNIAWLHRYVRDGDVTGLDIEPTALAYCRERGYRQLTLGSATHLPFESASQDLVTAFDVVQQLPNSGGGEQMFREIHRVLRPGGLAFVRSAAYEWMRSGHDAALHTQHRFTVAELAALAELCELDVVRRTYANTTLLPVAAVRRLLLKRVGAADRGSDVKPLAPGLRWVNRGFTAALRTEARILRRHSARLPFGLSAIVVVRRPGGVS